MPWPSTMSVVRLPDFAPDLVAGVEDWEIFLELEFRGAQGFVTNDGNILRSSREMVALTRTKLMLVVTDGVGHDPLKANGLLQVHLTDISRDESRRPAIFRLRTSGKMPLSAAKTLDDIAVRRKMLPRDVHVAETNVIRAQIERTRPHLLELFRGR